ncbi:MAG TPA: DUF4136 domain-containing protein [Parafilimonas sp.]|nr:DUF4136 domain-containing protein [Parafilimonas sp.]
MKMITRIVLVIAGFIFFYSCSAPTSLYNTENLSTSGYSQYKTYAFQPTKDTSYTRVFDKKRLEALMSAAAIKELSKKGMQLDTANPDCFFTYKLIVNRNYEVSQEQKVEYNPNVYTPAFDNDARIYTFSSDNRPVTYAGRLSVDTLREGSLVIDMIDRKQGNVVWRSSAQDKTQETFMQPTPDRVNEIVHKMFKKFPK